MYLVDTYILNLVVIVNIVNINLRIYRHNLICY